MNVIPRELVETIKWEGHKEDYDVALFALGKGLDNFYVVNPELPDFYINAIDKEYRSSRCVLWKHNDIWVVKQFHKDWTPAHGWTIKDLPNLPKQHWKTNPAIDPNITFETDPYNTYQIGLWDLTYKHTWYLDSKYDPEGQKIWVYECVTDWLDTGSKDLDIVPVLNTTTNKDYNHVSFDWDATFVPAYYDLKYEHVWYIDPAYTGGTKVWARSVSSVYSDGIKDMGFITPNLPNQVWYINPDVDTDVVFANDPKDKFVIPIWDINFSHVWYLDPKYSIADEKVWLYRCETDFTFEGTKDMGYVTPDLIIEQNPLLDGVTFELDPISLLDLKYENIWNLDEAYGAWKDMWAINIKPAWKNTEGIKYRGSISPEFKLVFNTEIPDLRFNVDYKIPHPDFKYEHIWYLDPKYSIGKKVWLASLSAVEHTAGVKDMGYAIPDIAEQLDVVFISYNEPNAEDNWKRVLEKAPNAKRVNGVKGIFEAHKAAALVARSDMFYVVDGDAYLTDEWQFDFSPNIFDRDCVHVYRAMNPINDLTYGYGGVKLFPRKLLLDATKWKVDMTTSIAKKLKVLRTISNVTAFNTDEISTWRSAFRECAKLAAGTIDNQISAETERRLKLWTSKGGDRKFGKYAIAGANAGVEYGLKNKLDDKLMQQINDRQWLDTQFKNAKLH